MLTQSFFQAFTERDRLVENLALRTREARVVQQSHSDARFLTSGVDVVRWLNGYAEPDLVAVFTADLFRLFQVSGNKQVHTHRCGAFFSSFRLHTCLHT